MGKMPPNTPSPRLPTGSLRTLQALEFAHVKLSGDRAGEYVVTTEERPDGSLTLVPDTSWKAIRERSGAREATKEEWEDFLAEHGPHMLPPDGEG
jgi:hypothetical protein